MTKIKDVYTDDNNEQKFRYIFEGEQSELTAYIASGATPPENSKWFVLDKKKTYYWSKSQNTFKELGWNTTT